MTPDEHTNQELFLEVGDGHELYIQDWGNKQAKTPIIWLHGGPGSSSKDNLKTHFSPEKQRVIFYDQRGCGRSIPYGSLEHNTTDHLVKDIDAIADKLGFNEFILVGGSWGSCLALAYGVSNPGRVKAMVLRGIFTGSKAEIDWLDQGLFHTFYPEAWEQFLAQTPTSHHQNPTAYHAKVALSDDAEASKKSAYAYECLEASVIQLDDRFTAEPYETYDPAGIKIEIQYMQNNCFMPDRHILDNAHKLSMPIYLVQGRYDMVCPPTTAYELAKTLPNGNLVWTISGHKAEHETWSVIENTLRILTA
jgi:proline iminopeptidase